VTSRRPARASTRRLAVDDIFMIVLL